MKKRMTKKMKEEIIKALQEDSIQNAELVIMDNKAPIPKVSGPPLGEWLDE